MLIPGFHKTDMNPMLRSSRPDLARDTNAELLNQGQGAGKFACASPPSGIDEFMWVLYGSLRGGEGDVVCSLPIWESMQPQLVFLGT